MTTHESEKADKRRANRRLRRRVREVVTGSIASDILPALREVSSVWSIAKDGRSYWKDATSVDFRK